MKRLMAFILCAIAAVTATGQEFDPRPITNLIRVTAPEVQTDTVYAPIAPGQQPTAFTATGPVRQFLARVAQGIIWRFSNPARHHRAAVMVQCPDGSAGSGTIIRVSGNACVVITCEHVVRGNQSVEIRWQDGHRSGGNVVVLWAEKDLAAVHVTRPPTVYESVPISTMDPPQGEQIEVMGFGGPEYGTFRPYAAPRYEGDAWAPLSIDAPSISGDSGGGMVWNGALVGVQFGAYTQANPPPVVKGVELIYPASSKASAEVLTQFGNRACQLIGGQCQPIFVQPMGQPGGGMGGGPDPQFYPQPVQAQPQPIPQQPPQPQLPYAGADPQQVQPQQPPAAAPQQPNHLCPPGCQCDPSAIADAIREGLEGMQGPTGPEGPQGPAGPAGKDGADGKDGQVTPEQIQAIVASVSAAMKADPMMRGATGPAGPPGKDAVVDLDELAAAVAKLLPGRRFLLVDGSTGEVIDDETYAPGEAIVLDVQRIVNAAKPK